MTAFVATPQPKKPKIPNINLGELKDAFISYLEHRFGWKDFLFSFDADRGLRLTELIIHGPFHSELGRRVRIVATLYDVEARSWGARLGSEPFVLNIVAKDLNAKWDVLVEPQPEKAIAFHEIKRWENGHYILEGT